MDKNEFDSDFDFEKEYGFSLDTIMGSDDEEEEDELLTDEDETSDEDMAEEEADDHDDLDFDSDADHDSENSEDYLNDADFDLDALTRELGEEPAEDSDDALLDSELTDIEQEETLELEEEYRPEPKKKSFLAALFGFGRPAPKERRVRPRIEYDAEELPLDEQPVASDELDLNLEIPEVAELDFAPVEQPEPAFEAEEAPVSEQMQEDLPPEVPVLDDPDSEPEAMEELAAEAPVELPDAEAAPISATQEIFTGHADAPRPRRRKKRSKMRIFKDVYLPPIIAGVAFILILTFVIGSISRAVQRNRDQISNDKTASDAAENEAMLLQEEAEKLLEEAAALAAIYDYEGAIAKLDTFSGDISSFTQLVAKRQDYAIAQDSMVEWIDPSAIPNLSFHVLIADPGRAFSDAENGAAYNMNFVTTDEFSAILKQLYNNNYVLVDYDCFIEETTGEDGRTTYTSKPLYLPQGKKPIMITETLVNYFGYMIDGNDDGVADASGAGFASRLTLDANGNVTAEMVDANGNTVTGDYDLVPILNRFIAENDGFSYRNSKAILAVCGYEGIFGYRIQKSVISAKGQDYYDEQVNGAKAVVQALQEDGYTIACYTYNNLSYGDFSATDIQADLLKWNDEIAPVIGDLDVLVYARSSDISDPSTPYSGSKFNVLYSTGFRYFVGSSEKASTVSISNDHVRQTRLQVTGLLMSTKSAVYSAYFDAASVLNSQRGAQ